jgi:hypothetical protein
VIAIGVLAALGWAIHGLLVLMAIAGALVFAALVLLTVAGVALWRPPPPREPRCDLCGSQSAALGQAGVLVACVDAGACDQRRRERAGAEGAGAE